jgi:hypothetical protein
MKKKTIQVVAIALAFVLAGGFYWRASLWLKAKLAPPPAELRATQQDEDAVPPPEPSVSVQLNGSGGATVARGGPLTVTVAAAHRHAVNIESRLRILRARAQRPGIGQQSIQQTRTAVAALEAASRLRLGDAARPWTQSVQVTLRSLDGGDPAPWTLRILASQSSSGAANTPGMAVLDAENAAEVHLAPQPQPWATLKAGRYEVRACLAPGGEWKATACSQPVQLTVVESDSQLTAQQRDDTDRHAARVALLGADWAELERRGNALLPRDKVAGHIALGDAFFGRQVWDKSLSHYTAARAAWPRGNCEPPRMINIRIARLLAILGADE